MPETTNIEKILTHLKEHGVIRARDLAPLGIASVTLTRMVKRGLIERVSHGLYRASDSDVTQYQSMLEAQKKIPSGVICLISALNFHELTTQLPFEVWMAIDIKAYKPKIDYPPVRFIRFSGDALTYGVDQHIIDGIQVNITSPSKTVADCFKYRNKIGLDVAIEALKDYKSKKAGSTDALWEAAKVCRVLKVMRPYMEAMA